MSDKAYIPIAMPRLTVIAALMLALLFVAAPADAACVSGGESAVATDVPADVVAATATSNDRHCHHVPCSDATHNHASGGCAGHSFVPAVAFESSLAAIVGSRVAFTDEASTGRTPPPPVPPPLA